MSVLDYTVTSNHEHLLKKSLGFRAKGRKIIGPEDTFELREMLRPYSHPDDPDAANTYLWNPPPTALRGQFLGKN